MAKKSDTKAKSPRHQTRKIKQPTYKSFHVSKRIKQPKAPLTGAFRLFVASAQVLMKNWRLFGGIILIYLIMTIVLVKGFGVTSNIGELKSTILELFDGGGAQFITSVALFSVLLGNASSTPSEVAGAYQSMLFIVLSLVFIWALRQCLADKKPATISVADAFYKGLYPLVPFVLVLLVVGLQLVPLILAQFLYGVVIAGGLAITAIEQGLWIIILILLALLSFYMITSSIFALYIVTLPDVRPLQALRSARELVRHRRGMILRKLMFLPVTLLVLAAVIIVPIIIVSPTVAEWVFFGLSMLSLAIVHSYLYTLYRELL